MKQENTSRFRKILAGLCMLCMVCVICFGTMSVYAREAAELAASDCTAQRGKTVSVTLNLEGNPGIWGLKFKVGYDHSALKLTSVKNGTVFSEEDVVLPESLEKEQYVFLATAGQLEDIQADGSMVTLNFEVAEEAAFADYPVTLEITQAINVDGKNVSISGKNGNVKVQAEQTGGSNLPQPGGNGSQQAKETKTGDDSHLILWIVFAGISGGILLVLGVSVKKKRWIKA